MQALMGSNGHNHPLKEHGRQFRAACARGDLGQVRRLVSEATEAGAPDLVNWWDPAEECQSGLHQAAQGNHPAVVAYLLQVPGIMANTWDWQGQTPLRIACTHMHREVVRILASHPAVEFYPDTTEDPLWIAACYGRMHLIEILLACRGGLNIDQALNAATRHDHSQILHLLHAYRADEELVISSLRRKLGWHTEAAAQVLAVVIFVCDDFLVWA